MKQALLVSSLLSFFATSSILPAPEYEPKVKALFSGFFKPFMKLSNQNFFKQYCNKPVENFRFKTTDYSSDSISNGFAGHEQRKKRQTSLYLYKSTGSLLWALANIVAFMAVTKHFRVHNTSIMKCFDLRTFSDADLAIYTSCHAYATFMYAVLSSGDLKPKKD
jgi:hypothetical protein